LKAYTWQHLVGFEETNLVGNVYFANYLLWQGSCRERFLYDHAPGIADRLREDLALMTVRCGCDYFAELKAFDTVELRMSLEALDRNKIAMRFDYVRLGDEGEQIVARGEQVVACMARREGGSTPIPIPEELHRALLDWQA